MITENEISEQMENISKLSDEQIHSRLAYYMSTKIWAHIYG